MLILLLSTNNVFPEETDIPCLSSLYNSRQIFGLAVFPFPHQTLVFTTWFLQSNREQIYSATAWQVRLKFRSFTTHFYWVIPLLSHWHFPKTLLQLPIVPSSVFSGTNPGELATLYSPCHPARRAAYLGDVNLQRHQQRLKNIERRRLLGSRSRPRVCVVAARGGTWKPQPAWILRRTHTWHGCRGCSRLESCVAAFHWVF